MGKQLLRVRLFAALKDQAGWEERLVPLPASGVLTPGQLWHQLGLGETSIPATVRVAINQAFAANETPLTGGDEVAFLPPISGG
jgi:molybdopterin synthase sulfur carrier subunit